MNGYPTDEELSKWIEELEKQPLYAPAHMKEVVLCKLQEEEIQKKEASEKAAFFLYSFKMVVGMAAAIVLLFAIPANDGSNKSYAAVIRQEREAAEQKIDAHFENGRDKLSRLSKKINGMVDRLFQRDDLGGFDYES